MIRWFCTTLLCVPCVLYATEFSVSIGQADSRWHFPNRGGHIISDTLRVGLIQPSNYSWDFEYKGSLKLEFEAGLYKWDDAFQLDTKYGAYLTPMWRYYIGQSDINWYLGAGIGLSYTNSKTFMDRQLGSRWNFEDRLELGALFYQKHRVSVSFNHYSNANLAPINHGVDVYVINYAYTF